MSIERFRCCLVGVSIALGFSLAPRDAQAQLAPSSWPRLYGDSGQTGQGTTVGPSLPVVVATTQLGGRIYQEPVIAVDNTAYVAAFDGVIYAVNPDGSMRWTFNTGYGGHTSPTINAQGVLFSATPAASLPGGSGPGPGRLFAINPDGTQKWVIDTAGTGQGSIGFTAAPNIAPNGTLYTADGTNSTLLALNPDTGATLFQLSLPGIVQASIPALAPDGTIYVSRRVASQDYRLTAVTPAGVEKWTASLPNNGAATSGFVSPPAVDPTDGTIYVESDNIISALSPNGVSKWVFGTSGSGGSLFPPAIAPDGSIRYANGEKLFAINPNGTLRWNLPGSYRNALTIDAAGTTYVFNGIANNLTAVSASGNVKWTLPGTFFSGVAIRSDGFLVVGDLIVQQLVLIGSTPDVPTNLSLTVSTNTPGVGQAVAVTALVTSANSTPISNVSVSFSLISGSGSFSSTVALTNLAGQAFTIFTPSVPGLNTIQASTGAVTASASLTAVFKNLAPSSWPRLYGDSGQTGQGTTVGPSLPVAVSMTQLGGQIRQEPVVAVDNTVYVAAIDGVLYAVNPDGSMRWTFNTGHGGHTSPTINAQGLLFSATPTSSLPGGAGPGPGKLFAINSDGTQKWMITTAGTGTGSPGFTPPNIAANGTLYTVDGTNSTLLALNPDTGATLFQLSLPGAAVQASIPALALDGTIYVSRRVAAQDYRLTAVTPTGVEKWTASLPNNGAATSGFVSPPAVDPTDGTIYVESDNRISALSPNGISKWVFDTASSGGGLFPPAIAPDGSLRYANGANLTAINPDGTLRWRLSGNYVNAVTIDAAGTTYVFNGVADNLSAVSASGNVKWTLPGTFFSGVAMRSDGFLAVGNLFTQQLVIIGSDSTTPTGISLTVSTNTPGVGQSVAVTALVTNAGGASLPNVSVEFSLASGNGSFSSTVALTNLGGQAFTTFTPSVPGLNTIQASTGAVTASTNLTAVFKNLAPSPWPRWQRDGGQTGQGITVGPSLPVMISMTQLGGQIRQEPVIAVDSTVYVVASDGLVYAVNPDGSIRWTFNADSSGLISPTINAQGVLFSATRAGGTLSSGVGNGPGRLFAINSDGTQKWMITTAGTGLGSPGFTSPNIAPNGTLYTTDGTNSTFLALNPDTGATLFQLSLPGLNQFSTPALAPDGTIYISRNVAPQDYRLTAVTPAGAEKWTVSLPNRGAQTSGFMSPAAVDPNDGTIYVESDNMVSALSPNGVSKWVFDTSSSGGNAFPPAIAPDGSLRYANGENLMAINPNGTLRWSLTGNYVNAVTIDAAGTTYVFNGVANNLTAVSASGNVKWVTSGTFASGAVLGPNGLLIVGDIFTHQIVSFQSFAADSADQLVTLDSNISNIVIATVSVTSPDVSLALASASASGLTLVSLVYDITPSTPFSPPATLTFRFDPLMVPDTTTLAIYRYDGVAWSSSAVTSQIVFVDGEPRVTGSLAHSSFYALFTRDITPPQTSLLVNFSPLASTTTIITSTDVIGFSATDSGIGVDKTLYAIDGSSEQVFLSTFTLAPGNHLLSFHSVDLAGNDEAVQNVSINVLLFDATPPALALSPVNGSTLTTTAPALVASYSDLGRGVDLASVRLDLDGQDLTSSATITASSASFTPGAALAQGAHTVTASVSDLAGNSTSTSSAFFIDSLPPLTNLLINGLVPGSTNLILASTDMVSFTASDSGVGVLETRYSVDGATEVVFATAFFLTPGNHALVFHSSDRAGNQEAAKTSAIIVASPSSDTTPPLVRLDYPGASGVGVEQAIGGIVNVRGAVSDASAVSWTLEAAPGASATIGFTAIASGAGNLSGLIAAWNTTSLSGSLTLRLRAADSFGNAASATTTVFVGTPVFTFAIGRKDSDAIISTLKGPTGIAVRSDGAVWVASTENDKILLISPAGVLLGEAGQAPGHSGQEKEHGKKDDDDEDEDAGGLSFKTPQGLALDAAGNLFVADRDLNRVVKLSPNGQTLLLQLGKTDGQGRTKPGSGTGELRHPFDVAVDANGDIYVADSGNRRIQVFNSSGMVLSQFGQGILLSTSEVRGIALTSEGLWVSDKELEVIHLFSRSGSLIKTIGSADSAVGEISRTRGLASDRLGALYVVEPNRDRTQKFDPQGKGLFAFGSKAGLSHADKKAKRYLTQPIDAAVAPDGSIWITDTGRDRIVRYALPTSGFTTGGGTVSSSSVEPARRVVDHKDGAKVERDDGAGVHVPKGALVADLEITVEKGDENLDKEEKTAKRKEMKITAVSDEVQYGPEGTTFNTPVTLTLPYDANLIAAQGIKEDDLKVYYWNPTLKDWQVMPSTVDKQNKTVNAQTNHFSAYQVGGLGGIGVAALDDFGLRDGYAFPNPSRNGSAVTFRMQPGSVDSIEVRVYDLSGRKVHSSSDFRFRGAFDDGNGKGAQNTYDHAWDVSGLGSGVYTFVMTARKAGQSDIRKAGKVGVIK